MNTNFLLFLLPEDDYIVQSTAMAVGEKTDNNNNGINHRIEWFDIKIILFTLFTGTFGGTDGRT